MLNSQKANPKNLLVETGKQFRNLLSIMEVACILTSWDSGCTGKMTTMTTVFITVIQNFSRLSFENETLLIFTISFTNLWSC
jgi:hypothetical protein